MAARQFDTVGQYQYKHNRGVKLNTKKGSVVLRDGTLFFYCLKGRAAFVCTNPTGPFFKLTPKALKALSPRSYEVQAPKRKYSLEGNVRVDGVHGPRKNSGGLPTAVEVEATLKRIDEQQARPTFDSNDKRSAKWFKQNLPHIQKFLAKALENYVHRYHPMNSSRTIVDKSNTDNVLVRCGDRLDKKRYYDIVYGFHRISYQPFYSLELQFDAKYFDAKGLRLLWAKPQFLDHYSTLFESEKANITKLFGLEFGPTKVQRSRVTVHGFDGYILSWTSAI